MVQGAAPPDAVRTRSTNPAALSAVPGVYTEVRLAGVVKTPSPVVVHILLVAVPDLLPAMVAVFPAQIGKSTPALAIGPLTIFI